MHYLENTSDAIRQNQKAEIDDLRKEIAKLKKELKATEEVSDAYCKEAVKLRNMAEELERENEKLRESETYPSQSTQNNGRSDGGEMIPMILMWISGFVTCLGIILILKGFGIL